MKNFVALGDSLTLPAPSGGVTSGTPVIIDALVVVPVTDAAEGQLFAGRRVGVFSMPVAADATPAVGKKAYLTTGGEFTQTASGNKLVGAFLSDAADGAADVLFTGQVA